MKGDSLNPSPRQVLENTENTLTRLLDINAIFHKGNNIQSKLSGISSYLSDISEYACLDIIIPENKEEYINESCLNLARKDIVTAKKFKLPPILDELGFSVSRHFLFNCFISNQRKID